MRPYRQSPPVWRPDGDAVHTWNYYHGQLEAEGNTTSTLHNSTVSYSQNAGIFVSGTGASLAVSDSTITSNGGRGPELRHLQRRWEHDQHRQKQHLRQHGLRRIQRQHLRDPQRGEQLVGLAQRPLALRHRQRG